MAAKIGILALQGAFIEHIAMLTSLGAETVAVRLPKQLNNIDGLIIPGGESTTISKLMHKGGLYEPILNLGKSGLPIWGTCAGAIILAQQHLKLMDITVERNGFGRQIDSFVANLNFASLGAKPFPAVFIRAPIIKSVGENITTGTLDDGTIVAAQQNKLLATAFHPELTDDNRFHKYFLNII
jgi:5'-phosphate synthase pdxT subunit